MIVPCRYWPDEFLQSWKPSAEQREEFDRHQAERKNLPLLQVTPEAQKMLHQIIAQNQSPGESLRCRVTLSDEGNDFCLDPHLQPCDVLFPVDDLVFVLDEASAKRAPGTVVDYSEASRGFAIGYA